MSYPSLPGRVSEEIRRAVAAARLSAVTQWADPDEFVGPVGGRFVNASRVERLCSDIGHVNGYEAHHALLAVQEDGLLYLVGGSHRLQVTGGVVPVAWLPYKTIDLASIKDENGTTVSIATHGVMVISAVEATESRATTYSAMQECLLFKDLRAKCCQMISDVYRSLKQHSDGLHLDTVNPDTRFLLRFYQQMAPKSLIMLEGGRDKDKMKVIRGMLTILSLSEDVFQVLLLLDDIGFVQLSKTQLLLASTWTSKQVVYSVKLFESRWRNGEPVPSKPFAVITENIHKLSMAALNLQLSSSRKRETVAPARISESHNTVPATGAKYVINDGVNKSPARVVPHPPSGLERPAKSALTAPFRLQRPAGPEVTGIHLRTFEDEHSAKQKHYVKDVPPSAQAQVMGSPDRRGRKRNDAKDAGTIDEGCVQQRSKLKSTKRPIGTSSVAASTNTTSRSRLGTRSKGQLVPSVAGFPQSLSAKDPIMNVSESNRQPEQSCRENAFFVADDKCVTSDASGFNHDHVKLAVVKSKDPELDTEGLPEELIKFLGEYSSCSNGAMAEVFKHPSTFFENVIGGVRKKLQTEIQAVGTEKPTNVPDVVTLSGALRTFELLNGQFLENKADGSTRFSVRAALEELGDVHGEIRKWLQNKTMEGTRSVALKKRKFGMARSKVLGERHDKCIIRKLVKEPSGVQHERYAIKMTGGLLHTDIRLSMGEFEQFKAAGNFMITDEVLHFVISFLCPQMELITCKWGFIPPYFTQDLWVDGSAAELLQNRAARAGSANPVSGRADRVYDEGHALVSRVLNRLGRKKLDDMWNSLLLFVPVFRDNHWSLLVIFNLKALKKHLTNVSAATKFAKCEEEHDEVGNNSSADSRLDIDHRKSDDAQDCAGSGSEGGGHERGKSGDVGERLGVPKERKFTKKLYRSCVETATERTKRSGRAERADRIPRSSRVHMFYVDSLADSNTRTVLVMDRFESFLRGSLKVLGEDEAMVSKMEVCGMSLAAEKQTSVECGLRTAWHIVLFAMVAVELKNRDCGFVPFFFACSARQYLYETFLKVSLSRGNFVKHLGDDGLYHFDARLLNGHPTGPLRIDMSIILEAWRAPFPEGTIARGVDGVPGMDAIWKCSSLLREVTALCQVYAELHGSSLDKNELSYYMSTSMNLERVQRRVFQGEALSAILLHEATVCYNQYMSAQNDTRERKVQKM